MDEEARTKIPVELWQTIFSWVPFKDQVNCRAVCKDWSDFITTLPEFKSKNCLIPRESNCTLDKLSVLKNSDLKFNSLIFRGYEKVDDSLAFTRFLVEKVGETVTYLDVTDITSKVNKLFTNIVSNLSSFKVLHHFRVGSLCDWLCAVNGVGYNFDLFSSIIERIKSTYGEDNIRPEMVRLTFNDEGFCENFIHEPFFLRFKGLIQQTIIDNLQLFEINDIAENIECKVRTAIGIADLSRSRNTSVRVLSTIHSDLKLQPTTSDVEKIFQLLPNLTDIHICPTYIESFTSAFKLVELHPEKIKTLWIDCKNMAGSEQFKKVKSLNFPNLENLVIFYHGDFQNFAVYELENLIRIFPNLKTINLQTEGSLPDTSFEFFTKMVVENISFLNNLHLFKNLKELFVRFLQPENEACFLSDHQPFKLESLKQLSVVLSESFCSSCLDTLLQSLPNLRKLNFDNYYPGYDSNGINSIFTHQFNLEELKIVGPDAEITLDENWPVMKNLKKLEMFLKAIRGSERDWNEFFKKLEKVEYLQILSKNYFNVTELIGNNMPYLRHIVCYEKGVFVEKIFGNGRKIDVEYLWTP